ncbi:hypothetical protein B0H13DRAFT_1914199 [Mycena leptocephala]|nr:hypothetical protein B0H13DRAFT_1914199 [Mycena leptocephala]
MLLAVDSFVHHCEAEWLQLVELLARGDPLDDATSVVVDKRVSSLGRARAFGLEPVILAKEVCHPHQGSCNLESVIPRSDIYTSSSQGGVSLQELKVVIVDKWERELGSVERRPRQDEPESSSTIQKRRGDLRETNSPLRRDNFPPDPGGREGPTFPLNLDEHVDAIDGPVTMRAFVRGYHVLVEKQVIKERRGAAVAPSTTMKLPYWEHIPLVQRRMVRMNF